MLKDKDLLLLKIMEKSSIDSCRQLMILGGDRDPSVTRKRVKKLKEQGFVNADWSGDHIVYTLSQKGLYEQEKTRRPYDVKGVKAEHDELVSEAASWLYIMAGLGIMDMVFEHEMNALAAFKEIGGHKPDIVFAKHQALEVELSSKPTHRANGKNGLEDNFLSNQRLYTKQIWIVPERKKGLIARINAIRLKAGAEKSAHIITLEQMQKEIASYDLSQNAPRVEPVIGIPTPLKNREKDIMEVLS